MGSRESLINGQCKNLLESARKLNRGASSVMENNTADRHIKRIDHRVAYETGLCDRELWKTLSTMNIPERDDALQIVRIKFDIYLYEKSNSSKDLEYTRKDMHPLSRKVLDKGYSFLEQEDYTNGFFSQLYTSIWMCRLCDFIVTEYQENFELKLRDGEDYNPALVEALKNFGKSYCEEKGLCYSRERYVKTYIHEYMHLIYDELSIETPSQTVNEAFSWFCSYRVLSKLMDLSFSEAQNIVIPTSSNYREPEKISKYTKMLWKSFSESSSDNFVSWTIEKQKSIVNSTRTDEEALRLQIVPEKLRTEVERFNSIIKALDADFRRLEAVMKHYRMQDSSLPVDQLFEDLESLEPDKLHGTETEIIQNYDIEEAEEYFRGLMREEVKRSRKVGDDLIQIEQNMEQLPDVNPKNVQRAKKQIEEMDNPPLKEGDTTQDLIWDILVVRKDIHEANKKIHKIASENR